MLGKQAVYPNVVLVVDTVEVRTFCNDEYIMPIISERLGQLVNVPSYAAILARWKILTDECNRHPIFPPNGGEGKKCRLLDAIWEKRQEFSRQFCSRNAVRKRI